MQVPFDSLCYLHAGTFVLNSTFPTCDDQIPAVIEALYIAMSVPSACTAFLTCCSTMELNSTHQQSVLESFTKLDTNVQLNVAALYAQFCHIEATSQSRCVQKKNLRLCEALIQDAQVFEHCFNVVVGKVGLCALSFPCMCFKSGIYNARDFVLKHPALSACSNVRLL